MRVSPVVLLLALVAIVPAVASARESWVGLNLRVQPVYIEMNQFNPLNAGVGAEGSFFPHQRLLLQGRYSRSLANGNSKDYEDFYGAKPDPEIKPFSYWEAGGQINLIVTTGEFGNSSVRLDSTRYDSSIPGQTRVTEYSTKRTFLLDEHQCYGVRGGVFGLESGMAADLGKEDDVILFDDGTPVDPAYRDLTYSNHKMSGYYAGVAKTRIYYREGLFRTFFADVLVSTKTEYAHYTLTGFTERKVGGRIGFEGARRHIGGRLEAGVRPGVDKLYVLTQLSFGVML